MRRRRAEKRIVTPDPKHSSELVSRMINVIMEEGKKGVAERVVYGALDIMQEKLPEEPVLKAFSKAIDNVRPKVELKARRVGGATYQVPVDVSSLRGTSLALRWVRDFARKKKGKPMLNKIADELIAAYKQEGAAIKKRDETHKMAEANKAFSHFRW
ncbi:MAG: 30S ribosomal protein S7 [Candidatus Omnitrophica bacterium]|nr:30S ribosomal protein S7 [Candidatus Omnitrophota bacterium]